MVPSVYDIIRFTSLEGTVVDLFGTLSNHSYDNNIEITKYIQHVKFSYIIPVG